jgi:hypothetical protein
VLGQPRQCGTRPPPFRVPQFAPSSKPCYMDVSMQEKTVAKSSIKILEKPDANTNSVANSLQNTLDFMSRQICIGTVRISAEHCCSELSKAEQELFMPILCTSICKTDWYEYDLPYRPVIPKLTVLHM